MKSKLESLVAYLAGREDDDGEWVRHELGDPGSEASQFLAATRKLSRDAFAEHVLKWLGLSVNPFGKGPVISQRKPSLTRFHVAVWVLPWFFSVAACALAILLWLDCRKHRQELEAALEVALVRPQPEADFAAPMDEQQRMNPLSSQSQRNADGRSGPPPSSASGELEQRILPDEKGRQLAGAKERTEAVGPMPTTGNDSEQGTVKGNPPPAGPPATGGREVVTPDPPAPGKVQAPNVRKPGVDSQKHELVAVPKIEGLSYADAKKRVEAVGVVLKPARNRENGLVKGQNPAAGTLVKRGDAVLVTLTLEPSPPTALVQVPNVCGVMGAENVDILLKRAGLALAAYRMVNGKRILIAPQNYDQLGKFKVVKQRPLFSASVPGGTFIECIFEAP
jgi:hypothetical protein